MISILRNKRIIVESIKKELSIKIRNSVTKTNREPRQSHEAAIPRNNRKF